MVNIYVLKCDHSKYYIGKSKNTLDRITHHFYDCGSQWTKKYKPIEVIETIPDMTDFDEDKYTKIYMFKYGIDNVRGGSYTTIKLLDWQIKAIESELASISDHCYRCKQEGHFASECPSIEQPKKRKMTRKAVIKNNKEMFGSLFQRPETNLQEKKH
jgi:hypothetical protein